MVFETVQLARRWTGPDALAAGIVQQIEPLESLVDAAMARASGLARLGAAPVSAAARMPCNRRVTSWSAATGNAAKSHFPGSIRRSSSW